MKFELVSDFEPKGDQPQAIDQLVSSALKQPQTLLGITGSGKTFTMANVIAQVQKPALILAHNKTLAAQLYEEFKAFFPKNHVEYFVSYYDYYQPEAYIARSDTYIEKDLAINQRIEKMRLSATRSLMEEKDVIIVSSISCIYGLGMPEHYRAMNQYLEVGTKVDRDDLLLRFVDMHYKRSQIDLDSGTFRVRGDVVEVYPAYEEDLAYRIEFFDDEIERISEVDPLTGRVLKRVHSFKLYPASHYVVPEEIRESAIDTIKTELKERAKYFQEQGLVVEKERIIQRTRYDLEMIQEIGYCKGIENYSRHFSKRGAGEPPDCLIDYFPEDFLFFIDESHQTIPQMHAMYNGDRARKQSLVEFGFRLPSAFDNRPLKFEETFQKMQKCIYVSATPGEFEVQQSKGVVVNQIIRPTGLLDPVIEVRDATNQIDDVLDEIQKETKKNHRVLVTTLTKKLAEDVTKFLKELGIKATYLHSDIDTIERIQIILELRKGVHEVLVGINLLREGLDIPEVAFIGILDADKQGFLRSETALIQTCGRAARNVNGRVVMYGNQMTTAMKNTIEITQNRRKTQEAYNAKHGITPKTVQRTLADEVEQNFPAYESQPQEETKQIQTIVEDKNLTPKEIEKRIKEYKKLMDKAAKELRYEEAAKFRDLMHAYEDIRINI